MKEKAKFNRISWIDIARGMCITAIVIGHTLKNSWLRTYALSFDVPMFFFLSGYCYRHTNDLKFPVLLFQQMIPFTRELLKDSNTALGIVCGVTVSALSILIALTGGEVIRKICPFMIGETKLS